MWGFIFPETICPLAADASRSRASLGMDGRGRPSPHELLCPREFLRGFDQLHLSISRAVEDHYFAFGIAEDEDVAVAEVGFLDGFFEGHGTHGDCVGGSDQVYLGGLRYGRIFVDEHRHGGFF